MISMTGFGRAVATAGTRRVVVEVRSVNHRGLEVKVRGRALSAAAEVDVIRFVRSKCSRGSLQVSIEDERDAANSDNRDDDLSDVHLQAVHGRLEGLRHKLGGLDGRIVDLMTVQAFIRLERERGHGQPAAAEALRWEQIQSPLAEALEHLRSFRATEGQVLAADLQGRARRLGRLVDDVRTRLPASADRARRRLTERLTTVAASLAEGSIDAGRLAQEVAILSDRLDVSEEMARLDAHLVRLAEILSPPAGASGPTGEGVGRPLEFLLQELGRELNTLGTKAQDADISTLVIAGKAELEKIREQAQNVE